MENNEIKNEENSIIKYLIAKKELRIPLKFLRSNSIKELEKVLDSGRALFVSGQYRKMFSNVDYYFNLEEVESLIKIIKELEISSTKEGLITELSPDDEKIISLLATGKKSDIVDFLEMAGPYYFFLEVAQEWENSKLNTPLLIRVVLIMWLFVNTYEILLHQVDRNLLYYLNSNKHIKKTKNINFFLKNIKRTEFKDHATAEKINKVICDILNLKDDNSSIFGRSSKPKVIRNKISHSNMYFDGDTKKIILLSGEEYDLKDFIKQYFEMFNFMTKWLGKYSSPLNKEQMRYELQILLKSLSNEFLRIERGSKAQYRDFIIKIKKEIEEKKTQGKL